jgi:hypothetical protein
MQPAPTKTAQHPQPPASVLSPSTSCSLEEVSSPPFVSSLSICTSIRVGNNVASGPWYTAGAIPVDSVYTSLAHQAALAAVTSQETAAADVPQQQGKHVEERPPASAASPAAQQAGPEQGASGRAGSTVIEKTGSADGTVLASQGQGRAHSGRPAYVLFAVDGTWRQAGEMMRVGRRRRAIDAYSHILETLLLQPVAEVMQPWPPVALLPLASQPCYYTNPCAQAVQDTYLAPHGPAIRVTLPPPPPPQAGQGTGPPLPMTDGEAQEGVEQLPDADNPNACLLRKEPVVSWCRVLGVEVGSMPVPCDIQRWPW